MKTRILLRTVTLLLLLSLHSVLNAQKLTDYAKQRKQELIEMQKIEKQHYDNACKKGTLEAFQEYVKMYPKGIYIKDICERITDFDMWNSAKARNTKESYTYYLNNSKYQSFKSNANSAIAELNSIEKWNSLKTNGNIEGIQNFLQEYPTSSCMPQAKKRIHELKAINLYNGNEYLLAYNEFIAAGGKNELVSSSIFMFDKCVEAYDYSKLSSYSKEVDLQVFLSKYPNSKKFDEVSNWLAISKAKSLNMYSGAYSYNDALNFAKDESTRNFVKSYIEKSKREYSSYQSRQRKARIKANGGIILFGLELMDFGWNCLSEDKYLEVYYYNVGASVKLGNYKSPIQLEVGLKPGVICYKTADDDDYYDSEEKAKFHMPAYAKLKVNICNLDAKNKQSKLYICGLGEYNVIREEYLENEYSVGGGFGMAWRHWDWLTLYYKQDLNNKYKLDDKFLGTSCVYYF